MQLLLRMAKMEMETDRGTSTGAQAKAETGQQKDGRVTAPRQAADTLSSAQDIDGSPSIASLPNAFKHYMARPEQSPQMRDRWRGEDDHRDRHRSHGERSVRRHRSPSPRRLSPASPYRGRDNIDTDSYRPPTLHSSSRDSWKHHRRSPSPQRSRPKPPHPQRPRAPDDRISRARDFSPERGAKRRRTQSPSPSRSDRWARGARRRSHSRDHYDRRGRPAAVDRAFSSRRASPERPFRPESREYPAEIDSYIPAQRKRSPSLSPVPLRRREPRSPSRRREARSPSRRREARSPSRRRDHSPPRQTDPRPRSEERNPTPQPQTAQVVRARDVAAERSTPSAKTSAPPSKAPSAADEADPHSMDGHYQARGHGHRGGWNQTRPHRPYVDTRQHHYGASPPYHNPSGSYHGSPHSATSHYNRGSWNGPQGHHSSMHNGSPPYRQNSYSATEPHNSNAYYQNQHYNAPHHQPYRGGYTSYRGNQYQYRGNQDRRPSGPYHYQNQPTRARGGYYSHHTWTPAGGSRGGPQNPHNSRPNSVRASPTPSHPPSLHDERDAHGDESVEDLTKRPQDDAKQTPPNVPQDKSTPSKDGSKFSFAFKSKQPPMTATKPPADLTFPAKTAPRSTSNRDLPVYPKKELQVSSPDRSLLPDRNAANSSDRKHALERPAGDGRPRVRSQSPPPKKAKTEPLPRRLPAEYAKSESIYFRKPGNESVVGAGTYGKVFKAAHIYTGQLVALKKIRMEGERDGFPITATREIRLLQRFKHKHVVDLLETMVERNEAYMVFEYLSHDLTGLINHPTFRLTAAHKKDLAHQLFDGLDFLHRRGVLHRDIKAANILISSTGQVKYADFGLARTYSKNRQLDYTNRVITIWYRPPELVLGETQYGPAVDVWSLACVFMEMFTRKAVFPGDGSELSQLDKIYTVLGTPTRAEWPKITELPWFELMQPADRKQRQFETMFSAVLSEQGLDLVKWCFQYDPVKRPTAEEVLQHPYFTSEDPKPAQVVELEDVKGDWHEFESKAHRRGEEKRRKAEWEKDRAERKKREREAKEARKSEPVSAAPSDKGQESAPPAPEPEVGGDDDSDGEGSARMDMSPE
ncbi:hypothetical protein DV737_g1266, partial [Chaetothyriales sp. CBS 132003]